MINLLPSYWQKKLDEEEFFGAVIILGIVIAAASLSFILMLLLARVYFSIELKEAQIVLDEKKKEMEIYGIAAAENNISSYNKFILKAKEFYNNQVLITEIIKLITGILPDGITLSEFGISSDNVINLSGFSRDRNSLILFKSNLEKESSFSNVIFPPENWLMAQDIIFDINLKYEPKR